MGEYTGHSCHDQTCALWVHPAHEHAARTGHLFSLGTTCGTTQGRVMTAHEGGRAHQALGSVVWRPGRGPYQVGLLPWPTLGTFVAQPRGLVVVLILAAVRVFCSGRTHQRHLPQEKGSFGLHTSLKTHIVTWGQCPDSPQG